MSNGDNPSMEEMKEFVKELLQLKRTTKIIRCCANAPYSGCFSEPNYWLLKATSRIHPIYVSGEAYKWFGFDKMKNANEIVTAGVPLLTFCEKMEQDVGTYRRYEDHEILDVWDVDWNPNVLNSATMICMLLNGRDADDQGNLYLPRWECSICGEVCAGVARFLGYTGNGGVGIILKDPCCQQCFSSIQFCGHCYKYVTPVVPKDEYDNRDQIALQNVDMERNTDDQELLCPNCELDEDQEQELSEPEDCAVQFGLDGTKFLDPDGDEQGLEGISIVILRKGVD